MLLYLFLILIPLFVLWFLYVDVDFVLLFYLLKRRLLKQTDSFHLANRVVWITGASSGIGEALAYRLASLNCKLILSARRENELEKVKAKCIKLLSASGTKADHDDDVMVLSFDMTDLQQHASLVENVISKFGCIDYLVLNAGRGQKLKVEETSFEVIKSIMDINFMSCVSLTKLVLPHMLKCKKGMFVITSSVAGKFGPPSAAAYSASKHALQGFYDGLRAEIADRGLNVLTVCPGWVTTHVIENCFVDEVGKSYGDTTEVDRNLVGKETATRMSPENCAYFMSVGMEERLSEIWPAKRPLREFTYLKQYFPTLLIVAFNLIGNRAQQRRDGVGETVTSRKDN